MVGTSVVGCEGPGIRKLGVFPGAHTAVWAGVRHRNFTSRLEAFQGRANVLTAPRYFGTMHSQEPGVKVSGMSRPLVAVGTGLQESCAEGSGMKRLSILVAVIAGGLACAALTLPDDAPALAQANGVSTKNADRRLTQQIRHSLVTDKTLSTYAHNVKILVHDGQVTLRGPVRSDAERQAIEHKAKQFAGAGSVTNELTVQPSAHAAGR